ncbi:MAG: YgiT-type zinc finger protein [Deltaproteobacteria bacterium]|nr:YgiT-type zinc finger protein [Deltaproteobacteria bacterium]
MKCVICHGDEIGVKEVKEEFMVNNDIIYVPIKVPVCNTCGERYYDRRTMQTLEEIECKLSSKQAKLKEVGKVLMYS